MTGTADMLNHVAMAAGLAVVVLAGMSLRHGRVPQSAPARADRRNAAAKNGRRLLR